MALFRLLMGHHVENDADGRERHYKAGDVFESKSDLLGLNGGAGMTPKFELIQQQFAPHTPPQPFTPMQREPLPKELEAEQSQGDSKSLTHETVKSHAATQQPKTSSSAPKLDEHKYPSLHGKPAPKNEQEFNNALHALSVKELHTLVEDEDLDLDLKKCKNREEMVKAIQSAYK